MSAPQHLVIPLDARPVCYQFVMDLAQVAGLPVTMPPPELLGMLKQPAPLDDLASWWKETLHREKHNTVILALDTLAYGGLIAGRVNTESAEALQERISRFLLALHPEQKQRYAFSSILRIPNYNNAEEEPDYWAHYGSALYAYSETWHREDTQPETDIPPAVVADFLMRREKNHGLNHSYLFSVSAKVLDYLVFCQDDTGPYGLNVMEAMDLQHAIDVRGLQQQAHVQTGADEVAVGLLSRSLWHGESEPLAICPVYFPAGGEHVLARFDGLPIRQVVNRHIQTVGGQLCTDPEAADLLLAVNAPETQMGDHCAGEAISRSPQVVTELLDFLRCWLPKKPMALADVVHANGADGETMAACLTENIPLGQLAGYAAWNTPGNTIGSALAMGAVTVWAKRYGQLNADTLKSLLLTRLLDDWYYQTHVRGELRRQFTELPPETELNQAMQAGLDRLQPAFNGFRQQGTFSFPCNRTFEIAVRLRS